ncbi:MAG: radical SAM protein [Polyangiaceae bacterium]
MSAGPRLKWLEISPDYRCNNRCLGCFSVNDSGDSMSGREIVGFLELGRRRGASKLWLGGGEPTLRKDLLATIRTARKLGYSDVKLQTNGMLLAYPEFVQKLCAAGLTEVSFSLKGADAASHDRLTATPGCYELLVKGIELCRATGLALEGDVLIYKSSAPELASLIQRFFALGLQRFNLWLLSAAGSTDAAVVSELPRVSDVMPYILEAMDLKLSPRADFITSLHTPPCTVPASHAQCRFHAAELGLLVGNPGGYHFMLEDSPIEGGVYFERCSGCSLRGQCSGARADYVERYGEGEFQPPGGG